jgi:hypothetical protein
MPPFFRRSAQKHPDEAEYLRLLYHLSGYKTICNRFAEFRKKRRNCQVWQSTENMT